MTNNPPTPPGSPVSFRDNPLAPDIFADAVAGWHISGPNLRIVLEAWRPNHATNPVSLNRVVIGRLVMSLEQAEKMARETIEFIQRSKMQQAASAQTPTTVQ